MSTSTVMQEESLTVVNINVVFLYGKTVSQGNKFCQAKTVYPLEKQFAQEYFSSLIQQGQKTVVNSISIAKQCFDNVE